MWDHLSEAFDADLDLPVFAPDRPDPEMAYAALACACGSASFRASGWPRVAEGRGGQFWRTLTRVWREARHSDTEGESRAAPFRWPLQLECEACGREGALLLGFDPSEGVEAEAGAEDRWREAYRCRVCRRASVGVVVGLVKGRASAAEAGRAAEVLVRCEACHRQARLAWLDDRPSTQQQRLDLLYGRR